jgi:hypothetical protein
MDLGILKVILLLRGVILFGLDTAASSLSFKSVLSIEKISPSVIPTYSRLKIS